MKHLLSILLISSICLSQEMEVDGNLRVTGTVESATIDSLQGQINSLLVLIAQLEMRIAQLECTNSGNIPPGYCDCFGNVLDVCGVCGGDAISEDECYVTDIDGYIYEAVGIGDQIWMAENLKVTHYNNGDDILTGYTDGEWHQLQAGAYAVYDDDPSNSDTYGKLYNWHAVDDDRGVCPEGWHVPSYEEWTILTDYLGGTSVAGGKMKEEGLDHWDSPNTLATNESGFTGLAAGYRNGSGGHYSAMLIHGYFWSFFENSGNSTYSYLSFNDSYLTWDDNNNEHGFSIRCVLGD